MKRETLNCVQVLAYVKFSTRTFISICWWTGEAAGLAMGLVMLGSFSSTAIDDMVAVSYIVFQKIC